MNVFHKVTLQSLKKNRVRTIVTIIGIILSAAMICAVTTFVSSMQDYALRTAIYSDGSWHGNMMGTSYSVYDSVSASDKVESASYMQQLGYAYAEGCTNPDKPYLYVLGASEGAGSLLPIHITSGSYPASSDQILLPTHLASDGGVQHRIGESITLELGERMSDGYALNQNTPLLHAEDGEEETLEVRERRSYTVVGFYSRFSGRLEDWAAPGYTAITIADEIPTDNYLYDVYFKMHRAKDIYAFMEENGLGINRNTDVLLYQGLSQYDSFTNMLMGLAAIVIGLIMFGSVSLIYNAFSISVSERTKQFGLLSSVGATKKQLRGMVFFEALCVAAIGIPLGILSGIGGIGVTLMLIGSKFSGVMGNANVPMRLCVSWAAVAAASVIALITVLISAWIPSKRATRVSAVEAIRQNTDVKVTNRPVKTSKLTYKVFGLPGMLASKYYKRSRRKYRTTVMSLFMSIVLFVSVSAFTDYLVASVTGGLGQNEFDIWYYSQEGEGTGGRTPDEVLDLLKAGEHVDEATYSVNEHISGLASAEYLVDDAFVTLSRTNEGGEEYGRLVVYTHFIPDAAFKALLAEYGLREEAFINPDQPLAVTIDGNISFNREEQRYTTDYVLKGDAFELVCDSLQDTYDGYNFMDTATNGQGEPVVRYVNPNDPADIREVPREDARQSYVLRSGKTIYEFPYFIDKTVDCHLRMIYPISLYERVIPESARSERDYYRFFLTSTDHAASYKNLETMLMENGMATDQLYDYAEAVEQKRNMILIVRVFAYGFVVLISLIAAANVFNTISTNISLRRREFAMLKSVGMTPKGFNKMANFECLLYGTKALMFGLPVSCGVTYFIYLAIMEGYETVFRLPWGAMGVAVLSVFLVVSLTMLYSMSKIKKDNPIDALKNENL